MYDEFKGIDAVLTLGGGVEHSLKRVENAALLYFNVASGRSYPLYHVLTGYCSGLKDEKTPKEQAESRIMREKLLTLGVPDELINVEDESLDTIANFVYSQSILDDLQARNIAVVVDKVSVPRVLKTGKRVLGTKYSLLPYPIDEDNDTFVMRFVEGAIIIANAIDFTVLGLRSGDNKQFREYLDRWHPFHSKRWQRYLTAYGFSTIPFRMLGKPGYRES